MKSFRLSIFVSILSASLLPCTSAQGQADLSNFVAPATRDGRPLNNEIFANTPSSVVLPAGSIVVGYVNNRGVSGADGARLAGSSAINCSLSPDIGTHWTACAVPPAPEGMTIIGGPALAAGYSLIPGRPNIVHLAVEAIAGPGTEPNRILVATSTDAGHSFEAWNALERTPASSSTAKAPSIAMAGNLAAVAFVRNQGMPDAWLEVWVLGSNGWSPMPAAPQLPGVDRGKVRHPLIRVLPGGPLYLMYEVTEPAPPSPSGTDAQMTLNLQWAASSNAIWNPVSILPDDRITFYRPVRVHTHTLGPLGFRIFPIARDMAQMDFAVVPSGAGTSTPRGIVTWVGADIPENGPQRVRYEEFSLNRGTLNFVPAPFVRFPSTANGMDFLPTLAVTQSGQRAITWLEQEGPDRQVRLLGQGILNPGRAPGTLTNLTRIAGLGASTPVCASSDGQWSRYLSSVLVNRGGLHALVFHPSAAMNRCNQADIQGQQMMFTRWNF